MYRHGDELLLLSRRTRLECQWYPSRNYFELESLIVFVSENLKEENEIIEKTNTKINKQIINFVDYDWNLNSAIVNFRY